jgi:hypothetical protein
VHLSFILDAFDSPESARTGMLRPWRRAPREARALPRGAYGPVLFRTLAPFASICRVVLMLLLEVRYEVPLFSPEEAEPGSFIPGSQMVVHMATDGALESCTSLLTSPGVKLIN